MSCRWGFFPSARERQNSGGKEEFGLRYGSRWAFTQIDVSQWTSGARKQCHNLGMNYPFKEVIKSLVCQLVGVGGSDWNTRALISSADSSVNGFTI